MASRRSKYWMFLLYPENHDLDITVDSGVKILLEQCKVPCYYVLHDRDGKKPHYHVIAVYSTLKSESQVLEDFGSVCANGRVVVCSDYGACMRYLIHFDNDDKVKYEPGCVRKVGNVLPAYIDVFADMLDCKKQASFADVVSYALECNIKTFGVLYFRCRYYRPDLARALEKFTFAENDRLRMFFQSDYVEIEQVISDIAKENSEQVEVLESLF